MKAIRVIFIACLIAPFPALSESVLVLFNERVPYLIYENKRLSGLTGTPAVRAFNGTGIKYKLKKIPSKRQMEMLKANSGKYCLIGWFKNPKREVFANFTKSIYQDKPTIAITKLGNEKVENNKTLSNTIGNKNIKLLVKDGYSYGEFIDAKIAKLAPKVTKTTAENIAMLKMIHEGRADYMFTSKEEADGLIQASNLPASDFKIIHFSDMPQGNKRYILCSKKVAKETIFKLNSYIN